ncbi:MAG: hypothetical protein ACRDSJ_25050 [Rubrobacteraceae bacterium]
MPIPSGDHISSVCSRHGVSRKSYGVPLMQRLADSRRGLPRWWSDGAFREKSFLHGAQYLAGRRAPPVYSF